VYYLEQTDQFAIVKISTTRSGAMGMPDTRLQDEDFYSIGDIAEILVPVRRYQVEFKQQDGIPFSFLKSTQEPLAMSAVNTTN
jgi:glyoxylate carboligase